MKPLYLKLMHIRFKSHLVGILLALSIVSFTVFAVLWLSQTFRKSNSADVFITPTNLSNSQEVTSSSKTRQPPTSISIPKINKDLPIQAAQVKDNNWQMFDKAVAWLATSQVPGEGNVILYAHNWKSLWADLYKLNPGDKIEVKQNQKIHVYEVYESRAVNPTDVESILSNENMLTMYTCEGSFDQKRRVVFAKISN